MTKQRCDPDNIFTILRPGVLLARPAMEPAAVRPVISVITTPPLASAREAAH
jgi:hypothetical protein